MQILEDGRAIYEVGEIAALNNIKGLATRDEFKLDCCVSCAFEKEDFYLTCDKQHCCSEERPDGKEIFYMKISPNNCIRCISNDCVNCPLTANKDEKENII